MRALFFLNSFAGGGAEKVCLNIAAQLNKQNIESDFVVIFDTESDYDIPDCIHVFHLNIEDKPFECLKIAAAVPKVNTFLSNKEYVLITAHLQPAQFLASLTTVRNKCLYVIHNRVDWESSWINRTVLRIFFDKKRIVAVSKGVENELNQKYGIKSENSATIYNPCGVATLKSKKKSVSPYRRPYILVMGRIVKEKDPLLALELYYKGQFYKNYDLIYLGKGDSVDRLKNKIIEYNMQNYVFLVGFQKNPEQWLMNASLLLSCSKREGFSMILAEALICGIPVVATDCQYGPNEILTDELSKYLIHPEDEFDESISIISSALENYPQITEKYYNKFDDKLIVQRYLDVWNNFFAAE